MVSKLAFSNNRISEGDASFDSYFASVAVDFIRRRLIEKKISFTFETVMSHPSKIEFLKTARERGYRTYLYFIATEDPGINISRVRNRVKKGGHDVPEEKIVSRYHRSLDLLVDAIRGTNRAYIFDNSAESKERTWLAEITDGREVDLKTNPLPAWFEKAVLGKIRRLEE